MSTYSTLHQFDDFELGWNVEFEFELRHDMYGPTNFSIQEAEKLIEILSREVKKAKKWHEENGYTLEGKKI